MGKGKRIQDFRNLNFGSSQKETEFIIEVQEKPRENKKTQFISGTRAKEKKKVLKKAKKKKEESPKAYIEKEKKRKKEHKQASMVVSVFLLVFIAIGVVAGCLITPTFDIQNVQIANGTYVQAAEIQKYFSEVKGKNIFLISNSDLEKNVELHPYIYQATVKRSFPNQLIVTYKERKPYLFLKYIESYVLMDKYANILEIKKENDMPDLPIVYGIETEEFIPGEKLEGIARLKFENIVYLLETAEHTDFQYVISEINYMDTEEMRISIQEMNVEIIYGSVEREILNDKITYLNEILKKLVNKKGTLDISSSNYSEKVIFKEILK